VRRGRFHETSRGVAAAALTRHLRNGVGAACNAQNPPPAAAEVPAAGQLATEVSALDDEEIAGRIRGIFAEIEWLRAVDVGVSTGVVTLSGTVPRPADIECAEAIALRAVGVVTVENEVARDLDESSSLSPTLGNFRSELREMVRALPLLEIALAIGFVTGALGYLLAPSAATTPAPPTPAPQRPRKSAAGEVAVVGTGSDTHVKRLVAEERAAGRTEDLLDNARPVE
jgi:hypothetical protein